MLPTPNWIEPDWQAPAGVRVLVTTRLGGVSQSPYASFNLAMHVGDQPAAVALNRRGLAAALPDVEKIVWLNQVHGTDIFDADAGAPDTPPVADAAITRQSSCALAIMTADCLPVMLASPDGRVIAAAHAGWRGLAGGVLESTVTAFNNPGAVTAWLGPAIGQAAFEVGEEVRQAFVDQEPRAARFFVQNPRGRWQADLAGLARAKLTTLGVTEISDSAACTFSDPDSWFSYRRDGQCGRMATLIYRE